MYIAVLLFSSHTTLPLKVALISFADYTQCLQESSVKLQSTCDIPAGEEIYVWHAYALGDIQWSCFHLDRCTAGTPYALYAHLQSQADDERYSPLKL